MVQREKFLSNARQGRSFASRVGVPFRAVTDRHTGNLGYEKTEKHQRAISKTSSASNTGPDDSVTDAHGICMHQAHMNRLKIMNTKDYETRTPLHSSLHEELMKLCMQLLC